MDDLGKCEVRYHCQIKVAFGRVEAKRIQGNTGKPGILEHRFVEH